MSKEAMKLALEAMENMVKIRDCQREKGYPQSDADKRMQAAITALREALAKPDFWEGYVPEPVRPAQQEFVSPGGGYVPAIPAQQALDKKAENARELGLDYEPAQHHSKAWPPSHWTDYERSIAAAEREACAKTVEGFYGSRDEYAAAIRARSNT